MEKKPCRHEDHRLYDSYETAAKLGVSVATLNEYRKQGFIKGISIGRGFYFLDSEIEQSLLYLRERHLASASRNADRLEINTTKV